MHQRAQTYSELHPTPVCATIDKLASRIGERFPGSGLSKVAAELGRVAEENQLVVERLQRPLWWIRALAVLVIALVLGLIVWGVLHLARISEGGTVSVPEILQAIDATVNELIFLTLGMLSLVSLEIRLKRRTALRMLHRLRSIAHVVDMHQLTKDPDHMLRDVGVTASSPERVLTRAQLARYLDYCSELFALTSKLAALHAQHLQDPVVLGAVNEIESLTADLSRKVWQKITILDMGDEQSRYGVGKPGA